MDPKFSEFSYGYSVIREIEDLAATLFPSGVGRPILPSLPEEEQLGWDVGYATVGFVLFLQFKRGEFVSRSHPASPTWPHIGDRHYRFAIDTAGHQFAALSTLAHATKNYPVHVAYLAPRFHESPVFTALHLARAVLDHSYGCDPRLVPYDLDVHHRVASEDDQTHLICSEPQMTPNVTSRLYLEDVLLTFGPRERGRATADREQWTVASLVEQVQSACIQAQLPRASADLAESSAVEQLAHWCNLIGVTPILWVERPA